MKFGANSFRTSGVTHIEILAIFIGLILVFGAAVGMTRRESARTAACQNNLRQIGLALLSYADDNAGTFPPRTSNPAWPERLRSYYKQTFILICPSDGPTPFSLPVNSTNVADSAPRSYIFNGWNDYFLARGIFSGQAFPESAITEPGQTVLFGEKVEHSSHLWFDYTQFDDSSELDMGRHHRSGNAATSGSSNHSFADGSVRLLKWGTSLQPINLWAIDPEWRRNGAAFWSRVE